MSHTILTVNDHQIAYTVQGNGGPLLLLLHGFGEDSTIWEAFVPALARRCRVVCMDLPGFGRSTLSREGYSMEDLATAVALVGEAENDKRCIVIGHSMGGYAALAFAKRCPERLLGLGLAHSHPFADSPERIEGRRSSIASIRRAGHQSYVRQLIPGLFPPAFAQANPSLVERLINRGISFPAEAYTAGLQAMLDRPDRTEVLRQGSYPVLFLIGAEDSLIPQDRMLDVTYLPETSLIHRWSNVGHMGMFEAPALFQSALLEFLDICLSSKNHRE